MLDRRWASLTVRQALVWRNRLTLAEHAVAVQPDNPAARSSYAGALIREGRIDEAIVQLEHVMRIMPNEYTKELIERLRKMHEMRTAEIRTNPNDECKMLVVIRHSDLIRISGFVFRILQRSDLTSRIASARVSAMLNRL